MMNQNEVQGGSILGLPQRPLPNATAVLVLGILSIVVCFICGIIALSMYAADKRLYQQNPDLYTSSSYELLRAGRICAIIGLCFFGVLILVWIGIAVFAIGFSSLQHNL